MSQINDPQIEVKSHPYNVDPLMHGDSTLARCCKMDDKSFELNIQPELLDWLDENCVDFKFSVYFGIFYFKTDEDKVKFILRWI